ncbi:MAG: glycosyltransferase [Candidatus Magnetoovum sp. WYHC-5]|nr:glycosyltransferase [Candidatus Magnetoovum sp. WYHC-5]
MLVSVIVTTKNEEKNIKNALDSIKAQTYPKANIQIIVVDNNSTDKTKEIAHAYTDMVFNLGPERSAQRNFGVSKAQGEYFLFIDADMILDKNVISDCVQKVQANPNIVGVYVSEVIMGESLFNRIRRFERSFYDKTAIDGVRFIKKASFEAIGGFDEALFGGEDWDMDKRLRALGSTEYVASPVYHNESDLTLIKYLAKKDYYIKSLDEYIAKWGADDIDVKRQFSPYYRFLVVFLEDGKWKRFITLPHLAIGIYFIKFLVGIRFLLRKKG